MSTTSTTPTNTGLVACPVAAVKVIYTAAVWQQTAVVTWVLVNLHLLNLLVLQFCTCEFAHVRSNLYVRTLKLTRVGSLF